jgi:hypothetical protein
MVVIADPVVLISVVPVTSSPPEDMVCFPVNVLGVVVFAYPMILNAPVMVVVEVADPIVIVPLVFAPIFILPVIMLPPKL